jgi:hypothetical protein
MTDDEHDWWGGEDGGLWHCRRCGRLDDEGVAETPCDRWLELNA